MQQLTTSSQRIISKPIWIIALVSLFTDMASEMLYPIMPLYLDSIGYSAALIGFIEGIAELIAGLSKPYFGALSDQIQKRVPFIRIGYILSSIVKPLFVLSKSAGFILSLRVMDRIGKGLRSAPRDAMLSDLSENKNKGAVFGFHRSMDTIGAVTGPLIALIFLQSNNNDYRGLFLWALIPGLIAIALTLFLRELPKKSVTIETRKPFWHFLSYWRIAQAEYKKIIVVFFAFALVNSSDVFLLLRAKELGFDTEKTILLYVCFNIVFALTAYPLGKIADRLGFRNVSIAGLILFALVYLGISFTTNNLWFFAFLFVMYGFYYATVDGVLKAWISNIVPSSETGHAIGFFNGMQSIAFLFASSWFGLAWGKIGSTNSFMIVGITVLALAILLFISTKNKHYG